MTIKLVKTCWACPEQYDAFDEEGNIVGYLRLRHGTFRVECPDVGGHEVYCAHPEGDGIFMDDERDYYLKWAVYSIEQWIATGHTPSAELPPAPNVEYIVAS